MNITQYLQTILLIAAAFLILFFIIIWLNRISRNVTGKRLYACVNSDGTTTLYVYMEKQNVSGHRSARQDWWADVSETAPGKFMRVSEWYKNNVGYHRPESKGLPWCDPYHPATSADIQNAAISSKR